MKKNQAEEAHLIEQAVIQNLFTILVEIDKLKGLKEKIGATFFKSVLKSDAQIKIKNKCEKGTVIQGKMAQYIVEKDIYKVRFIEVIDPKTRTAVIRIDAYYPGIVSGLKTKSF